MTLPSPAAAFLPGSFARAPRFPALRVAGRAAFLAFLQTSQTILDERYLYELSKATREDRLVAPGTCAPCLRPCSFTSPVAGGERQKDGSAVPNWRETMFCDCGKGLNNRERAVLHFIESGGILPWMRLLLLGAPERFTPGLSALAAETQILRPFGPIPAPGYHLAVAADYLHHVPALPQALRQICEALVEGGRLVFTTPFYHTEAASVLADAGLPAAAELQGETHRLGWDILDMLRDAGFSDAAAYLYWSEELGYLGPMNFIFRAVK